MLWQCRSDVLACLSAARRCLILALVLNVTLVLTAHAFERPSSPQILPAQGTLEAVFSPWDDVEARLIDVLAEAHREVLVQAYILTSKPLILALIGAHQRGVDVQVLLDGAQLSPTGIERLAMLQGAGIEVTLETKYQSAHNKVLIIDAATAEATVITGSYNFTWSAQHKNAENILIARGNAPLAARYAANWRRHFFDAKPAVH